VGLPQHSMGSLSECDNMKFMDLAKLFYEWGWQIKPQHYEAFSRYLDSMLKRNRVMIIQNNSEVEAVILFYLTNDYEPFYKMKQWVIVPDDENGSQIYIAQMICKKWSKELRNSIREAIEEHFPNIDTVIYHRPPQDRCVKIKIGRVYV